MQVKRQLSFPVPFCTLSWQDLEVAYRTLHGRRVTLHQQSGCVEGLYVMLLPCLGPKILAKSIEILANVHVLIMFYAYDIDPSVARWLHDGHYGCLGRREEHPPGSSIPC